MTRCVHTAEHGFDFDRMADACANALTPGGVIVWVIYDETIDGGETGTSFRHALGFMERGLLLHDTMIYRKTSGAAIANLPRHKNGFEYMFVLSNGKPKTINIIEDRVTRYPGKQGGYHRRGVDGSMIDYANANTPPITKRDNVWEYSPGFNKSAPDLQRHITILPYSRYR